MVQSIHKFILPFPPSVNGLYGGGSGQKRFPSKKYKAWLAQCPELTYCGLNQPLIINYKFSWPDLRIRDGQNYMKAPLDYLVNQGVLKDDNWTIVIGETWSHTGIDRKNSRVEIEIILQ
jgi:Holliday junction resolvase RusA-like endonuclease